MADKPKNDDLPKYAAIAGVVGSVVAAVTVMQPPQPKDLPPPTPLMRPVDNTPPPPDTRPNKPPAELPVDFGDRVKPKDGPKPTQRLR